MENAIKIIGTRKGQLLTIDSVIAITLVAIILITATNYVTLSKKDVLPELNSVRIGYDLLTLLDNTNSFEGMNMGELSETLAILIPPTHEITINFTIGEEIKGTSSPNIPLDRFIGAGERVFVVEDNGELKFGIARFLIWSKN